MTEILSNCLNVAKLAFARYREPPLTAYAIDLKITICCCRDNQVEPLMIRRGQPASRELSG